MIFGLKSYVVCNLTANKNWKPNFLVTRRAI